MNKDFPQTVDSIIGSTAKGSYMVYDHSEEDNKNTSMNISTTAAAIEITALLCMAAIMFAYCFA